MSRYQCRCIRKSAFCLLAGVFLYALLNRNIYVFEQFAGALQLLPYIGNSKNTIVLFIRCFGCDALWSAALTYMVQAVLVFPARKLRWLTLCVTPGILFECLQSAGIAGGTADALDCIAYAAGCVAAAADIKGGLKNEENL